MSKLTNSEFISRWLDRQDRHHSGASLSSIQPSNSTGHTLERPLSTSKDQVQNPTTTISHHHNAENVDAIGEVDWHWQSPRNEVSASNDSSYGASGYKIFDLEREEVNEAMAETRSRKAVTTRGNKKAAGKKVDDKNTGSKTPTRKRAALMTNEPERKTKAIKTEARDYSQARKPSAQDTLQVKDAIDLTLESDDDVPLMQRSKEGQARSHISDSIKEESPLPSIRAPDSALLLPKDCREVRLDTADGELMRLKDELERMKQEHATRIEQLVQEKREAVQKSEVVEERLTAELSTATHARDEARREAEVERHRVKVLQGENDDLRTRVESDQLQIQALTQDLDTMKKGLETEKQRFVDLTTENSHLMSSLSTEKASNSSTIQSLTQELTTLNQRLETSHESHTTLTTQIATLTEENKSLQTAATLFATPPPSISSSSFSSTDDSMQTRIDNVRKTYIAVKRRHDNLYAIARDISVATKGWSLSFLGDLGGYLRLLRAAVDEEEGTDGGMGVRRG